MSLPKEQAVAVLPPKSGVLAFPLNRDAALDSAHVARKRGGLVPDKWPGEANEEGGHRRAGPGVLIGVDGWFGRDLNHSLEMTHACQWTHVLGENIILTMAHVEAEDALRGPRIFQGHVGPGPIFLFYSWLFLGQLQLIRRRFRQSLGHVPQTFLRQSLRSPNRSCPDKMLRAPMTNLEGRQLVRFLLVFPPLSLAAFCAFHFLGFCSFLVGCKKTTESLAIPRVGQFCFQLSPCSKPVPPIRWLFLRDEFPR